MGGAHLVDHPPLPQVEHHLQPTMSKQTQKLLSTCQTLDNQPIMPTTDFQLPMLSAMDPNSLIPTLELTNGGKLASTKDTTSTESESSTEETAAVTDFHQLRSMLTTSSVELFQVMPRMVNGTLSSAPSHSLDRKLEL